MTVFFFFLKKKHYKKAELFKRGWRKKESKQEERQIRWEGKRKLIVAISLQTQRLLLEFSWWQICRVKNKTSVINKSVEWDDDEGGTLCKGEGSNLWWHAGGRGGGSTQWRHRPAEVHTVSPDLTAVALTLWVSQGWTTCNKTCM